MIIWENRQKKKNDVGQGKKALRVKSPSKKRIFKPLSEEKAKNQNEDTVMIGNDAALSGMHNMATRSKVVEEVKGRVQPRVGTTWCLDKRVQQKLVWGKVRPNYM
ncbi:dna repair helicase [Sesbania bispinosa]|nr:dna repair helicase [Sesbania bispinosa]